MISSSEALQIFQGWRSKAVKLSFSTGASMNGTLDNASADFVIVTSRGKSFDIPLAGATFRKVPRCEVKIASMREGWSDAIEIRLPSGAFALLLLLSAELSPVAECDS